METTLVAVFDNQMDAKQALESLLQAGFSRSTARLSAAESTTGESARQAPQQREESIGQKVAHFFGLGEEHEATYTEAMRRGSCVLSVDAADDNEVERASDILERYHPIDIDERQAEWRQSGWQSAASVEGKTSIPVVEEELEVGKREVQRGGIRVITRAVERPVEETVELREEHATVQRVPADRAAGPADDAFKEQAFEMRTSAEEAVVGKTERVVEDVVIGKETSTREQTVRDSVRKTEVGVEQLGKSGSYGGQERRRRNAGYPGVERRQINQARP